MTVDEAIKTIIDQHGVEILSFSNKVQSMIMDFSSSHERDVQLFCLSCQKGLLRYGQKIICQKEINEVQGMAWKAKEMLQHDAFMDEDYATHSVNMLLSGLGFSFEISSHALSKEEAVAPRNKSTIIKPSRSAEYKVWLSDDNRIIFDGNLLQDLKTSAKNGSISAMLSLGNCYFHGIAATEDLFVAESYYRRVLSLGDDDEKKEAENRLNEIYNKRQANFYK